jgi:hypothetical protein
MFLFWRPPILFVFAEERIVLDVMDLIPQFHVIEHAIVLFDFWYEMVAWTERDDAIERTEQTWVEFDAQLLVFHENMRYVNEDEFSIAWSSQQFMLGMNGLHDMAAFFV